MGSPRRGLVLLAGLAAVVAIAPAAEAARPNLVTTKLANPPKTAVVGGSFRVTETATNKGGQRAGRSDTRYRLSKDRRVGLEDLLMTGTRRVPALGVGQRSAPRKGVRATVGPGTPVGTYFLIACSDDLEAVRESKEGDNCLASRRKVRVVLPPNAPIYRVDAFSDFYRQPDLADDDPTPYRGVWCRPAARSKVRSLGEAIQSVKAKLGKQAGADGYSAFKRSADYKSADRAERAAAGAFLSGQPGAALAAMVRAHELAPKETSHVVNAAALATAVGMPSEALAMLDAVPALADRDRVPMGISREAVTLANRAQALAALGAWGDAERAANAAVGIEPFLTEAEGTAGVSGLCRAKPDAKLRLRKARKRQEKPPSDELGKETALRNLPFPSTPAQAVELYAFYRSESDSQLDELMARNNRKTQLQQQALRDNANPLTKRQRSRLLSAVFWAGRSPDLQRMEDEMGDLLQKSHEAYRKYWCDGDSCHDEAWQQIVTSCDGDEQCVRERCVPAAKGWHQEWLNYNSAAYQKGAAYVRAASKRMSAVAAQIKDPATYQLALIEIEDFESGVYFAIHQPAYYWTDWVRRAKEDCVEGFEPPPSTSGTDPMAPQGPGPCPDAVRGINASIEIGGASFKVNCSEIQVGGSLGAGWIKGFGEVTYDFRSGKITVFAGSQGEVGAGPLKGDFKSGIYVTATQQGFEDVGWRVGPSYTVGAGPAEFGGGDSVDMSFVGGFAFTDAP